MNRKQKIAILIVLDSFLIFLAYFFSYLLLDPYVTISWRLYLVTTLLYISLYIVFGTIFNVFTQINRYTSLKELVSISLSVLFASGVELVYFVFYGDAVSRRFIVLGFLFIIFFISASRVVWRIIIEYVQVHKNNGEKRNKTIIVGAGDGGRLLLESIRQSKTNDNIEFIGIVDDDKNKYKTWLVGKQVIGKINDLPKLVSELSVDMITIAIPSLHPSEYERVIDLVRPYGTKVTVLPSIEEIASGTVNVSKIRDVDVVDLLGREEVKLNQDNISAQIANKVILVTGAGGSIGSEICRQIMRFSPKQLILLGHGENSIYQIERELKKDFNNSYVDIKPLIADVQDRGRVCQIMEMYSPDVVYHAAAHKHVPLMEFNPSEAVKNNIFGTKNVAEAAKKNNVKSFVMISTDKAVNPPNVMGATKRVAEMIVTGLNEKGKTKFSAVRFGNVLGSRGSVIPLFKEQIKNGGPVTVTDFRMTRYFMTIPEASRLVIQSGAIAEGGEIFILDMGEPVKIVDLAKKIIKLSGFSESEIGIVETGIRPGEKLYEELLVSKEKSNRKVYDKIFVGNVNGFSYEETIEFIDKLKGHYTNYKYISEHVIKFANESSKC